jgi:hypothetical protein
VDFRGVTRVCDDVLVILARNSIKWQKIDLGGTGVTKTGIIALSKGSPNLRIKYVEFTIAL